MKMYLLFQLSPLSPSKRCFQTSVYDKSLLPKSVTYIVFMIDCFFLQSKAFKEQQASKNKPTESYVTHLNHNKLCVIDKHLQWSINKEQLKGSVHQIPAALE